MSRLPGLGGLRWRADDSGGAFRLTFDDGPDADGTPAVLDVLARHGARATFFLLVERARRHPALVRAIADAGHEVGLHGIDHRRLDRVPVEQLRSLLEDGATELEDLAGTPVHQWRPPFGRLSWRGLVASHRAGLVPVLWSHDPRDWDPAAGDDLDQRIEACLVPGAMVLLHDGADTVAGQGARTAAALDQALSRIPAPAAGRAGPGDHQGPVRTASLVVCTHRHGPEVVDALSTAVAGEPGLEVVLVRSGVAGDAALPGPLARWVADHPGAVVVAEAEAGAARARQRGLETASGDVVLYVDDDTEAQPGWARGLLDAISVPGVAAAGGTIEARFPGGRRPPWLPRSLATFYGEREAGTTSHQPFGANMALRREPALAVGGFEAGLGHVGVRPGLHEETFLCDRLEALGWRIAEAPAAVVHHRVRPEQVSRRWVLRRAWHEGRSDALRARLMGAGDPWVRAAKLAALAAVLPVAVLHPRAGTHVAARLAVNLAYLTHWTSTR